MSAKEMFEKYGFKYQKLNNDIDIRFYKVNDEINIVIDFYKDKYVRIITLNGNVQFNMSKLYLAPGVVRAINKQMEELEW